MPDFNSFFLSLCFYRFSPFHSYKYLTSTFLKHNTQPIFVWFTHVNDMRVVVMLIMFACELQIKTMSLSFVVLISLVLWCADIYIRIHKHFNNLFELNMMRRQHGPNNIVQVSEMNNNNVPITLIQSMNFCFNSFFFRMYSSAHFYVTWSLVWPFLSSFFFIHNKTTFTFIFTFFFRLQFIHCTLYIKSLAFWILVMLHSKAQYCICHNNKSK